MKVSVLWRFGGSRVLTLSFLIAVATAGAQCSVGQVCLGALAESPTCTLHPHLISSLHAFEASGRVDQVGIQPSEDRFHPQSAALGSSCIG